MENHWMFVILVVFLRLTIAQKGFPSPSSTKTASSSVKTVAGSPPFTKYIAASPSSTKTGGASLTSIKTLASSLSSSETFESSQSSTKSSEIPMTQTERETLEVTSTETAAPSTSKGGEETISSNLPTSTTEIIQNSSESTKMTTILSTEPPKLNNEIGDSEEEQSDLDSEEINELISKADAALADFLKQVLEELRTRMKTGMNGNEDNEILDPLSLEDMKLAPLVAGEVFDVKMEKITLSGLSDFRITQLESQVRESRIKLGLRYPQIQANCLFTANGTLYDIFTVKGKGNATLIFNEVHARSVIYMTRENGTLRVTSADQPYVDFSSASITFRDDTKSSQEVKAENVATQLGPLYFWVLTASAVERIDYPLALYLNEAMSKFMLPDILRRLTLRQRYLRIHVPNNPLPYAYVSPQLD